VGTYSNLLDAPKLPDRQITLSYLMASWRRVALTLLRDPLSDLPQPLNREQRRFDDNEIGVNWPGVVGQARGDGSMIPVGHADDKVRIRPTSNAYELDPLTMQRMVWMSYSHPFHRSFGKGGSVL